MTKIGNYETTKVRSMLALFKAVPGDTMDDNMPDIAMASLEDCILHGFIFINQHGKVLSFVTMPLFVLADEAYGIDKEINNQTFWKSFERVRDMDPREYVTAQILHYFSTYGMETLGLKACPAVPVQDLDIPDTMLPYKRLTVLRLVSGSDMAQMINNYALHTVSPSKTRIEQFKPLMEYLTVRTDDIKSFELQVIQHDNKGTVPANPQTFLRYLVYKITGQTLIIKNRAMRKAIENAVMDHTKVMLPYQYLSRADLTSLASIFFRYKPIFLSFKKFPDCAPIVNRIRRLADTYHTPLSDVSVQNFSTLVLANRWRDVETVMNKASNRELVKLYNFLCLRSTNRKDVPGIYNVRNGRTFVRSNVPSRNVEEAYMLTQGVRMVRCELLNRLSAVRGKMFYMPDYIDYAVPVTEKQFIGNIPWGSQLLTFNANEAFTTGVSWFDQKNTRVDIDLHLNSATTHFGWNSRYTDGRDIIYTGDMTAAPLPLGAAEAYYFKPGNDKFILSVNLYSGPADTEFKMYMSSKKPLVPACHGWSYDQFTFDPAEAMFAPIPMKFHEDSRAMNLGLFARENFYFYGGAISHGVVPSSNYGDFIDGLVAKLDNTLLMRDLLNNCGALMVTEKDIAEMDDEQKANVISLAPEDLTATTLLDIIDGNI